MTRTGNTYSWDAGRPQPEHVAFGREFDEPFCGDFDGGGKDTIGLRRGAYFMLTNVAPAAGNPHSYPDQSGVFGRTTDTGVVGDWDGDGVDTAGVVRGNVWYLTNDLAPEVPLTADVTVAFGRTTDWPRPMDTNGDGRTELGVARHA